MKRSIFNKILRNSPPVPPQGLVALEDILSLLATIQVIHLVLSQLYSPEDVDYQNWKNELLSIARGTSNASNKD